MTEHGNNFTSLQKCVCVVRMCWNSIGCQHIAFVFSTESGGRLFPNESESKMEERIALHLRDAPQRLGSPEREGNIPSEIFTRKVLVIPLYSFPPHATRP